MRVDRTRNMLLPHSFDATAHAQRRRSKAILSVSLRPCTSHFKFIYWVTQTQMHTVPFSTLYRWGYVYARRFEKNIVQLCLMVYVCIGGEVESCLPVATETHAHE